MDKIHCSDMTDHTAHEWRRVDSTVQCQGTRDGSEECGMSTPHDGHSWFHGDYGVRPIVYCPGIDEEPKPIKAEPAVAAQDLPPDMLYIRDHLLPEWWNLFVAKAADYNDGPAENHKVLGIKGQFGDMWRKVGKLKKALWDGKPLATEQPREITFDLISHCLLTVAMMDEEEGKR
jgi:hypothetical protein